LTTEPLAAQKDILGYTLKERIGSGGFGEVWSAVAPGGLLKAIKIVYGFHDEKRAQAEMKALDRVKELRHPFLLSLERIEIFEGQLVVVSELADNSLADVFNEFAAKNEQGIPRDELVKYMKCAADALDYLSESHNLQHLDVKPENLLMVSGHVKVADFGLIKDLQNASQSLMSGMTPAYAAPELFDGRPGVKSDQYSLAIVYQEMLTGIRPFPGNTPAQLAAQHMHGKPNLRPLPKGDQPVIAKALSKDPSVRYMSSREMVEELSNKKRTVKKAIRRTQPGRSNSDTESKTMQFGATQSNRDVTAVISGVGLPFQAAEHKSLDPPVCNESDARLQPTLIVTVGSTANRVAQKIKKQIVRRHGASENVPSVRLLCIDTDRQALGEMKMETGSCALTSQEIIETPLRKPEVYRGRSKTHLSWLSRRWIYNVPRSLQTEGLRPLGRLAFADHFETICDRIQESLQQIVAEENLAKSADTLDLDPGDGNPRIVIITSVSGGAGSGMVLDLAYTIKLLMHEAGLKAGLVSGVMLHSTYQRTRDSGLSAANAFAFLTELRHFVENGYPGDDSVGLPDFEDEPPFDFTYFNNLGDDLRQSEFDEKLDKIAEYAYLSTSTKCSVFFDECRKLESDIDHFALRTFGICSTGPGNLNMGATAVNRVCSGLLRRWLNGNGSDEFDANDRTEKEFAQVGLNQDAVIEKVTEQAHEILEGQLEAISAGAIEIAFGGSSDRVSDLSAFLDGIYGCPKSRRDSGHVDPESCLALEEVIGNHANVVGDKIATKVLDLIRGDKMELFDSKRFADSSVKRLEQLRQQLERATEQCEEGISQQLAMISQISIDKSRAKPDVLSNFEELLESYCLQRFQEFVLRHARVFYQGVANTIEAPQAMIKRYMNQIESIKEDFRSVDDFQDTEDEIEFSMDRLLSESIDEEVDQHILKTETQIYESLIKERGGYLEVLRDPGLMQKQLANAIKESAQRILADAYKKVSLEKVIAKNDVGPEQLVKWLKERIREAKPQIDDCGGASRLMIGLPSLSGDSILPEILEQQFNLKGCTIKGTQGNFVICLEGEDITLANVAFRLLEARPDAIELVKRIHTRNDIDWSTLDDLL
jgi:serine/threonine protein kinase